ncbi:FMN-binding protein [Dictyobacter kobayashii]|uniref:FMN-binding domain-containing protein n=1 Tax=Dictyobacter kobayashii TaxID=2014872 RepID=A0A402ACJ1_9CHLR|nr:FMN-binding protein [Dictyobacter kobayashii]GCE16798.1 hypothetical protein KDK_05980 [Dictyobacter kobayashii]
MKKLTVAVLIVGAFILYSLLFSHANQVAVLPSTPTSSSSSSSSSSTSGSSGSSGNSNSNGATPTTVPSTNGSSSGQYKDGSYTGSVADAHWGNIQVKAIIQNGKIKDVQFLQYPNDRNRSVSINSFADPQLTQEAIQAQNNNVDIVTGATDSSEAFIQSLGDALSQAKA